MLINNAGIMPVPFRLTFDGLESQFATNHIGHFLLTKHWMPIFLTAGKEAQTVNLTNDGYRIGPFRPTDYNFANDSPYGPWSGYGQSKTANILFTKGIAQRGVTSFAVHPGVIFGTGISAGMEDRSIFDSLDEVTRKNAGHGFEMDQPKSIGQVVTTMLVAALDPSIVAESGSYMVDCVVAVPVDEYARNLK